MKPLPGDRTEADLLLPVRKTICGECPFAPGQEGRIAWLSRFKDPDTLFGCQEGPGVDDPQEVPVSCKALHDWHFPKWQPLGLVEGFTMFPDYDAAPSGRVRLGLSVRKLGGARTPGMVLRLDRHGGHPSYRMRHKNGGVAYVRLEQIVEALLRKS